MIEARTLYRKKNHDDSYSFMLVLSTTRAGMNMVYFAPENASRYYENIRAVYFADFSRYLAFDRAVYVAWSKTNTSYYEKVVNVPFRVISEVTTAIKNLYDGIIVQDDDGVFHYFDEATIPPNKKGKSSTATSKLDSSNDAIIKMAIDAGIPVDTMESTRPNSDTKLVDLLESSYSRSYTATYETSGKKRGPNTSSSRRYFTEDEVLNIANMTVNTVAAKYKVGIEVARKMIHNSKNYINGNTNTVKKVGKTGITKLVKSGASFEEVQKVYPNCSIYMYNQYKKEAAISSSTIEDDTETFFEGIKNNCEEMCKVLNTGIRNFAIEHGCSTAKARLIYIKMGEILAHDIGFCANLGCKINDISGLVESIKSSNGRKTKEQLVVVQNYNIAKRLDSAYHDSFEYHADILSGMLSVPDNVSKEDTDSFLSLLHNRFSRSIVLSKDRILSQSQKDILNNGTAMDVAKAFMIDYKKAKSVLYNWRRDKK